MTAAYALSDYLPAADAPGIEILNRSVHKSDDRMAELSAESEQTSVELRRQIGIAVDGMARLIARAQSDAAAGKLPDLGDLIDAIEEAEVLWACRYLPIMGNMMGSAFELRRLQRDFSRLKAQKQLAQTSSAVRRIAGDVETLAACLEALRDARVELALIWSRYLEANGILNAAIEDEQGLDAYFETIRGQ